MQGGTQQHPGHRACSDVPLVTCDYGRYVANPAAASMMPFYHAVGPPPPSSAFAVPVPVYQAEAVLQWNAQGSIAASGRPSDDIGFSTDDKLSISSNSSRRDGRRFSDKNPEFQKGRFTEQEKQILQRAILNYVEKYELGEQGIKDLCAKKRQPELRGAWAEIATCLPLRSVSSCYHFGTRAFAERLTGKWTDDDISHLADLIRIHGRKWTLIGSKLNRLPCSCRDKWRLIERKPTCKQPRPICALVPTGPPNSWTIQEDQLLTTMILASFSIDGVLPEIGKLPFASLDGRTEADCLDRWERRFQPLIFGPEAHRLHQNDEIIIREIIRQNPMSTDAINWQAIHSEWPESFCKWRWEKLQEFMSHDVSYVLLSPQELALQILGSLHRRYPLQQR